jgi:hypothetical protein
MEFGQPCLQKNSASALKNFNTSLAQLRKTARCRRRDLYSAGSGIEHSLLQRFWLVARREEGSIAAVFCDPTSHNATSQKRRDPPGKGWFANCLLFHRLGSKPNQATTCPGRRRTASRNTLIIEDSFSCHELPMSRTRSWDGRIKSILIGLLPAPPVRFECKHEMVS